MFGVTAYFWNDEPVTDIHAWARDHGERIVRVRHTWTEPMVFAGRMERRSETLELPESWAAQMRFGGPRDDRYTVIDG